MRLYAEGSTYKVIKGLRKSATQKQEIRKDLVLLKKLLSPLPKSISLGDAIPKMKWDITKLSVFRRVSYLGVKYLSNRGVLLPLEEPISTLWE